MAEPRRWYVVGLDAGACCRCNPDVHRLVAATSGRHRRACTTFAQRSRDGLVSQEAREPMERWEGVATEAARVAD